MASFFDNKIEFLRGVGPQRAELLNKELSIFTYGDLMEYYPFRHEDRTEFHTISQLNAEMPAAHIKGRIRSIEKLGEKFKQRLIATFTDGTGDIELVWFQGVSWVEKRLKENTDYVIYGKPAVFNNRFSISHPEIEPLTEQNSQKGYFLPVYPLTEKLRKRYIDGRMIGGWVKTLIEQAVPHIRETLPEALIEKYRLISKLHALYHIHVPANFDALHQAQRRLKFEELFYNQLRLVMQKLTRREDYPGQVFDNNELVTKFYNDHLPFELTNAQVRVVKEILRDFRSGRQMNRLLQGDVGSGKTIVAFICMLVAIDGDGQACMMAPTEILAIQHYENLTKFANLMGIGIALLTGSSKKKERAVIHEGLQNGNIKIIVGTHALIEDVVQFRNLGLCIIDEQHRFGVAQRAKLWEKNKHIHPHFLVMTATPIPRTLAMAAYGDLDISEIDELPRGRKPIITKHKYDTHRLEVFGFMRSQIAEGRQVYIVYPLIEESEKLDYKNLMDGYESVERAFPEAQISIVHGKMKAKDKDFEMQRFKRHETDIMVATTVIEVGVDVPNATVMVIENAERFGLSQLHQLRGRVGRGGSQSYCILMSGVKLSTDTRKRLRTMVETNNGFEIAQVDLELRGPGDVTGTQQSGIIDLKVANLAKDGRILTVAREEVIELLNQDPDLEAPENQPVKRQVENFSDSDTYWSKIS